MNPNASRCIKSLFKPFGFWVFLFFFAYLNLRFKRFKNKNPLSATQKRDWMRSEPDLNRCRSFCRALPNRSAIRPFKRIANLRENQYLVPNNAIKKPAHRSRFLKVYTTLFFSSNRLYFKRYVQAVSDHAIPIPKFFCDSFWSRSLSKLEFKAESLILWFS